MLVPIIQSPSDGFMNFENMFLRDSLVSVYRNIKYFGNKFIIIAYFECGYTQDEIAKMLGVSQVSIQKRIKKTQDKLRKSNLFKDSGL